ncbi:MAG: N-acetylmuramoyl-L-alanine amidase [Anaerolineaceae bacterium]|jgi:N-acetylmuramoyl-L-alanine amidase|nr:N-acetylmuramoyl-L-alanine amidase [Anaerolineaceae bacterium]
MTDLNKPLTRPKSTPKVRQPEAAAFNYGRTVSTVVGAALILATLFTLWSPNRFSTDNLLTVIAEALQGGDSPAQIVEAHATPDANQPHVGLIAGHWGSIDGIQDPGAVCESGQFAGTTEVHVNIIVATYVKKTLQANGYVVDLLEEFDPRLSNYQADALISIHADSCEYINDLATGFKIAGTLASPYPEKIDRLKACITYHYGETTKLPYHEGSSYTADMLKYHVFSKVDLETPTVIIETGFMNLDDDIIISQPELVAEGIANGIMCFVQNQSLPGELMPPAQP